MAIKITSISVASNYPGDSSLYIAGVTSTTITVAVESDTTVSSVRIGIYDDQSPSYVDATEVSTGTWTFTRANTVAKKRVGITVIARDSNMQTAIDGLINAYTVQEHTGPQIDYSVYRCDVNGDRDMDGGYLSITAWATPNPSILSIASMGVYGESDEATPVVIIDDGEGGFYEITAGQRYIVGNGVIDPDTAYSLTFRAEDNYEYDTQVAEYVSPVVRIINVKEGGTGIAFAKRATEDKVIGKPDDWTWEGINEGFDSTGYVSATGTSGAITVKTWTISEAGVYAITATSYQTRSGYTTAQQATMSGALTVIRLNSGGTAQESYSQRAALTGGGDNTVSAIMNCSAGDTIECRVQQTAGSSGATLSSQTFYVRSALIKLV